MTAVGICSSIRIEELLNAIFGVLDPNLEGGRFLYSVGGLIFAGAAPERR